MGLFDEAEAAIIAALAGWDYSSIFPSSGYTDPKRPIIVPGRPPEELRNLEVFRSGQMTQPVISVMLMPSNEENRTLGNFYKSGTTPGPNRYAKRAKVVFVIQCWADQKLGAGTMARALAGQVQGAMLYNQNRTALKALLCENLMEGFNDQSQMWHCDMSVHATCLVSVDAA